MKTVTYKTTLQWVGTMQCPTCGKKSRAWRSSGMSMCFPHFYCDRCSNVIQRKKDQALVWDAGSQELLDQIVADLPHCPCGGRFTPGANPKCLHCGVELPHQSDPVTRLHDPHMIAMDGSCVFTDDGEPYRVEIVNE
jgi:hypothetical protein